MYEKKKLQMLCFNNYTHQKLPTNLHKILLNKCKKSIIFNPKSCYGAGRNYCYLLDNIKFQYIKNFLNNN